MLAMDWNRSGWREYNEVDMITHATETYLDEEETRTKLDDCVQKTSGERRCIICIHDDF